MIPKILKQEDNNLYLSEQPSKLFPEVNVQGKTKQGNNVIYQSRNYQKFYPKQIKEK